MAMVGIEGFLRGELFGLVWAAFFVVLAFTAGCLVLSYGGYLLLTPDGITLRTLFRSYSFEWTDIKYFTVCRVYLGKNVILGYSDPRKTTSTWTYWEPGIREVLIPQTYGMSARTLAELLTALQKHFIRVASKAHFSIHSQ
ncbi:MAG: hypothetical protein HXS48_13865 [Theionarchaea archaeon]|nr:hypothetical protein [Theionarchaea archaeon]